MNYALHLLIYFDIFIVVALGLNLIVGYCGLITLAQSAFFAIGGYGIGVLTKVYGWESAPAFSIALLVSAVLSLAISLPSWRVRGDLFVLVTLAFQVIVYSIVRNWFAASAPEGTWSNLTNGTFGIGAIPPPEVATWTFDGVTAQAIFATVLTAATIGVLARLHRSPWSRSLLASRDDEVALEGLGKSPNLLRTQTIMISCVTASLGGGIYAGYAGYIDPSAATVSESILVLSMLLVGGSGNIRGPIIGAGVLVALPEVLRLLDFPDSQAAQLRLVIYGLLLLAVIHFRPAGLAGDYKVQ